MNFTNDEMNLMCIYNTGSRESLMRELREMRGYKSWRRSVMRNLQSWSCTRIFEDHLFRFLKLVYA